ncbi:hypothetical protein KAH39_03975 [Alcaligenes faecalis]|uniref:hypothetical protein n=1 Tax=Alcaligenes faecalis TaxID=511 RepID=UPI00163AC4B8|nr:hypothetical protein [Alcaligenes faecalis]MBQ0216462.1 hypothetical protein [Alcaligenes faecalis]
MNDRIKVWVSSKLWFWKLRAWIKKIAFFSERIAYRRRVSVTTTVANIRTLTSFAWTFIRGMFWAILFLLTLNFVESQVEGKTSWLSKFTAYDPEFRIEQLRLYSQLLTAIFSIYFATIGIILSSGYTRLRRDIIQLLTSEHVGSAYSRILIFSAIFCLTATALPMFGVEPGVLIYCIGSILTIISVLALFPLGQRLFNFFDLKILVRSEILPSISRHIEAAAKPHNSVSLANHHSRSARLALGQIYYIDDRLKADKERLEDNLPALSDSYTILLLHYLHKKHTIDQGSYWFPRRRKHKQWFLAGDSATSMALNMSNQEMLVEEKPDHHWLEKEIADKLACHVELAFEAGDLNLALTLISRLSTRIASYAEQLQFDVGMQELMTYKRIIEQAFSALNAVKDGETKKLTIGLADIWAALGCHLILETLRKMIIFEKELERFFNADEWNEKSLRRLPAFLQVELSFIIVRIDFEKDIEGRRLSKPKYVQQLTVQKLLKRYADILPAICHFLQEMVPEFARALTKFKMTEAATQVVLGCLHTHWKLPRRLEEIGELMTRYQRYAHYCEDCYAIPQIDTAAMSDKIIAARGDAIAMLGSGAMVGHVFEENHNDELPDHFGQIYFELAEAAISAIENNDVGSLSKILPMFLALAILASDSKFVDPSLNVEQEFRLHLISTSLNDISTILGFSILYGAYFDNSALPNYALKEFEKWIERAPDRQAYFKRILLLSNSHSFSMSASPRDLIRTKWKMSFENRAEHDGFGGQFGMGRAQQHPNRIVREFIRSHSDPSHLFLATQVVPHLELIDFEIDRQISELARSLQENDAEANHEDY